MSEINIKDYLVDQTEPGLMYLVLLNGRKTLENHGVIEQERVTIGPIRFVHVTYTSQFNIGFLHGTRSGTGPMPATQPGIEFVEDMLCFDGLYFSDWETVYATD